MDSGSPLFVLLFFYFLLFVLYIDTCGLLLICEDSLHECFVRFMIMSEWLDGRQREKAEIVPGDICLGILSCLFLGVCYWSADGNSGSNVYVLLHIKVASVTVIAKTN